MRSTAVLILLMIIVSVYAAPTSASDITMTLEKDHVRVKMVLSLHQNVTEFPNQTIHFSQIQASNASSAISQALRKTSSEAVLSDFTLNLNSSKTWLNLTATMIVSGVSERRGDISVLNVTWKAFSVSADLRAANFSYNAVGRRYLRPVVAFYENASRFENMPNATIKGVNFFDGAQTIAGQQAVNQVGNFTILDFGSLRVPLEQWARTYNLQNNTTTWRYTPRPLLAISVRAQRLNQSLRVFSDYSYSAQISVPGLARAEGNVLFVDVGTGQKEWIMAGVVVLAVALAIATQFLFRAKRKATRLRRR